jgi:hypothetical protein
MSLAEYYTSIIVQAMKAAENLVSNVSEEVLQLEGMSGYKTRAFYNNLCQMPGTRYLEIGSWKGSTACAAMDGNQIKITCIDNWSQFAGPKDAFLATIERFKGANEFSFIEADCFEIDVKKMPFSKYNVYLYDGDHSFESHKKAITHYLDCLDDIFILIIDDWNYQRVREGTFAGIKETNLTIHYDISIRLTQDDSHTPAELCKTTWHNGIAVMVCEKPKTL